MTPLAATVIDDLVEELPVPKDGILSRILHDDAHLHVTGFAFAAGQELTRHTASMPAVVQVVAGRLDLVLGDRAVTARPGGWLLMPRGLEHEVHAVEPTVMLLTMIKDDAGDAIPAG